MGHTILSRNTIAAASQTANTKAIKQRKKPKKQHPPFILTQKNAERFVMTWSTAKCVEAVSSILNISTATASSIATKLRKQGVKLHKFPPHRRRRVAEELDINRLNRLLV